MHINICIYHTLHPPVCRSQIKAKERITTEELRSVQLTEDDRLLIIDQTLLPGELKLLELKSKSDIMEAIRRLQVRGAPAIGICAAYGIYILAKRFAGMDRTNFIHALLDDMSQLAQARPTAVNLAQAVNRMSEALRLHTDKQPGEILPFLRQEAVAIDEEDAAISAAIAAHAAPLITEGCGVLTHCNAGWLATSRLGTALAPLYLAHEQGRNFRVYCDETRPLLQGARLTAWELSRSGIDTTLICDNMAAALMQKGLVDIIFVGADRITADGSAANKIGTLSLAVNAAHFGIPFYVLAPTTTLDPSTPLGSDIPIEERSPEEVTELWYARRMAPAGIKIWNPAFDVTPPELITGIITQQGIL